MGFWVPIPVPLFRNGWPWQSYFTTLRFSFLICKMLVILNTHIMRIWCHAQRPQHNTEEEPSYFCCWGHHCPLFHGDHLSVCPGLPGGYLSLFLLVVSQASGRRGQERSLRDPKLVLLNRELTADCETGDLSLQGLRPLCRANNTRWKTQYHFSNLFWDSSYRHSLKAVFSWISETVLKA